MSKLARISHIRCGEPIGWRNGTGYTYVWIPDDWDEQKLEAMCEKARESYLNTEAAYQKVAPVPAPGYGATINPNTPDNLTVAELKAEYQKKAKAYHEYCELVSRSRKGFAWHLKEVSNRGDVVAVQEFWEKEPDVKSDVNWGHAHGTTIDHSPTKMSDFPFTDNEEDDGY